VFPSIHDDFDAVDVFAAAPTGTGVFGTKAGSVAISDCTGADGRALSPGFVGAQDKICDVSEFAAFQLRASTETSIGVSVAFGGDAIEVFGFGDVAAALSGVLAGARDGRLAVLPDELCFALVVIARCATVRGAS